ncbi:MAG: tetratricopeptide repeat protein [Erythrobacter sp.]
MDRKLKTGRLTAPRLALVATTAIAALALPGLAISAAPPSSAQSFAKAQGALAKGQVEKAIQHAEAAVLADPRNPAFRALLGAAYLEAGRFQSAATSFGDALDLGDTAPRTVLSFALAKIALGESRAAITTLEEHQDAIDPADLGLAFALAGQTERGVGVLIDAVRASETEASPKLRQNLAYSYALAGNWQMARVMAAEDVPADQLDARLSDWAQSAAPELFQKRIAALLDVTPRADAGQPMQLALANFPAQATMVAEAAAQDPVAAEEPVRVASAETSPAFTQAFAPAEPSIETVEPVVQYVSNPVVQPLRAGAPARAASSPRVAAAVPQRRMAATAAAVAPQAPVAKEANTHLVQLGAYDSKIEAQRGWTVLKSKFPQLKDRQPVITEAVVNGRTFWRVAADGFGQNGAKAMCGTVKSAGRGCFAYAASSPPKGAVGAPAQREVKVAATRPVKVASSAR